jgi:hypothetical protein
MPEYIYVEKARQLMEKEKQSMIAAQQEIAKKEFAARHQAAMKEKEKCDKIKQEKLIKINDLSEKEHTLVETKVHPCPLASSNKLIAPSFKDSFVQEWKGEILDVQNYVGTRSNHSNCDFCRKKRCEWTCEKCDFDVCQSCFEVQKLPEAERVKRCNKLMAEEAKRIKEIQEERERARKRLREFWEKQEKEQKIRDAKELEKKIGKPLQKHKVVPKVNRKAVGSGYTVWSASGGRWRSPTRKQFDSSWKSLDDAKQRAKYLFYVKNRWGCKVSEIEDESNRAGLSRYGEEKQPPGLFRLQMHDEGGNDWTVSIVPDDAFKFLDHVDDEPNHHDD